MLLFQSHSYCANLFSYSCCSSKNSSATCTIRRKVLVLHLSTIEATACSASIHKDSHVGTTITGFLFVAFCRRHPVCPPPGNPSGQNDQGEFEQIDDRQGKNKLLVSLPLCVGKRIPIDVRLPVAGGEQRSVVLPEEFGPRVKQILYCVRQQLPAPQGVCGGQNISSCFVFHFYPLLFNSR